MPTIAAWPIRKTRRVRWCEHCNGRIHPGESVIRVYGYAHQGDRPYRVFVCPECAARACDWKIGDALESLRQSRAV